MATVTFTGTTSGDMTVATNYAGGVAPGSGDTVIFNTGSRNVTVGPNVDLCRRSFGTSGWSGSFGTRRSPVTFQSVNASPAKFTWAGSGDGCYISVASTETIGTFVAQRGFGAISGAGTVTAFYNEMADFNLTVTGLTSYYGMTPTSRITIGTSATAVANESFSLRHRHRHRPHRHHGPHRRRERSHVRQWHHGPVPRPCMCRKVRCTTA
jgi:hypothetical protein